MCKCIIMVCMALMYTVSHFFIIFISDLITTTNLQTTQQITKHSVSNYHTYVLSLSIPVPVLHIPMHLRTQLFLVLVVNYKKIYILLFQIYNTSGVQPNLQGPRRTRCPLPLEGLFREFIALVISIVFMIKNLFWILDFGIIEACHHSVCSVYMYYVNSLQV